jgi:hypothetical protein
MRLGRVSEYSSRQLAIVVGTSKYFTFQDYDTTLVGMRGRCLFDTQQVEYLPWQAVSVSGPTSAGYSPALRSSEAQTVQGTGRSETPPSNPIQYQTGLHVPIRHCTMWTLVKDAKS